MLQGGFTVSGLHGSEALTQQISFNYLCYCRLILDDENKIVIHFNALRPFIYFTLRRQ